MIDQSDIVSIIKIALILFSSSFALYLPMIVLFGNKNTALQFTIPTSISVQIIFGYIFYCLGAAKEYPVIYGVLILVINILSAYKLIKLNKTKKFFDLNLRHISWLTLFLFVLIIFTRFYDSFKTIAPGEIDTYNHIRFLTDLVNQGFLSFPQYAPGYHLFIYPLTFVTNISEIYRFTGPIVGVISSLSLFVLFKDSFKKPSTKFILLALMCLPIFNQLTLQQIGFFSTSLTLLLFPVFLYILLIQKESALHTQLLVIYGLTITALSLTVPYLYIQYLPAVFIFSLIIFIARKRFDRLYVKRIIAILLITILGFFIAFGHVYLQTKILKRATSFPAMDLVRFEDNQLITQNNYTVADSSSNSSTSTDAIKTKPNRLIDSILQKEIFIKYITPMSNIARDAFSLKNIRQPDAILSIGAYLWIIFSFFVIPFALKYKNSGLLLVSVFSVVFGIATQFGILEISTYRGRSGWYLMLLLLIGLVLLYDKLMRSELKNKTLILVILVLFSFMVVVKPPTYYRAYYTDGYKIINNIVNSSPNSTISLIADDKQLSLVSDKISTLPFNEGSLKNPCLANRCFIVLEKKLLTIDPVLSQQAIAGDKDFDDFYNKQNNTKLLHEEQIKRIQSTSEFKNYSLFWENENIQIYELIKN